MSNSDNSQETISIHGFKLTRELIETYTGYISIRQKSVNEQSLFEQVKDSRQPIYRFWLFPMELATTVSIIQYKADFVQITVKETNPYVTATKKLYSSEIKTLEETVTRETFWDLPIHNLDRNGMDGYTFLLEALVDENYHVVQRWVPTDDDPFKTVCDYMYALFKTVSLE